ncbi:hypothetical protein J25TS5_54770 [Paenibacillus faecis]|nr:hypothetical protein J25TS5_54770 [Paenibacillus faecis]
MKRIIELVDEVFQICDEVADENRYEREWVWDRFRESANGLIAMYETDRRSNRCYKRYTLTNPTMVS